jgi:catechol 2,3-dioxygenase-like lactoylglutathione lyase family enzyme
MDAVDAVDAVDVFGSYPCLCVDDVERSLAFYDRLLDLAVTADLGWYVELGRPPAARVDARVDARGGAAREPAVVVALVERGHPSVPPGFDVVRGGVLVSVVVADAVRLAAQAERLGLPVVQPCRDEAFGQRHFMALDPDGFLVDVIERIPASLAVRRQLVEGRRRRR